MLHRPDQKTLAALSYIMRTQPGEALVDYLDAELQAAKDALVDTTPERVARLQGYAQAVRDIRDLVVKAPQVIAGQTS